jgi:hypothetical protein
VSDRRCQSTHGTQPLGSHQFFLKHCDSLLQFEDFAGLIHFNITLLRYTDVSGDTSSTVAPGSERTFVIPLKNLSTQPKLYLRLTVTEKSHLFIEELCAPETSSVLLHKAT